MLGRYPHVEPSRCATRDQGEVQLRQILEAGITTFVSLQVGDPRGVHATHLMWLASTFTGIIELVATHHLD